ncbi:hypothetical protein [Haladaptatus sp. NG-WS-4]
MGEQVFRFFCPGEYPSPVLTNDVSDVVLAALPRSEGGDDFVQARYATHIVGV